MREPPDFYSLSFSHIGSSGSSPVNSGGPAYVPVSPGVRPTSAPGCVGAVSPLLLGSAGEIGPMIIPSSSIGSFP